MGIESVIIKREDLKYSYSTKIYPQIFPHLQKIQVELNKILYNNFDAKTIMECLLNQYRRNAQGFNLSFTIHFLIYIFNLKNNDEDITNIILPILEKLILQRNELDLDEITFRATYSIRLLSYLHIVIRDFVDDINKIFFTFFNPNTIENSLQTSNKRKSKGFHFSLGLEFLIYFFHEINEEPNLSLFLIPNMKNFFDFLKDLVVIDGEKEKNKKGKSSI